MKTVEYEDLSEMSTRERKELARMRWETLPDVLKAVFQNAPKLSMYEVLRKLGVDAQPVRAAVEWAYEARDGSVVVTVWHDQIRTEEDGILCYFIPAAKWRKKGAQQQRADHMRQVLADNSGKHVKAMLLKHEWNKDDTQYAKVVAADIRTWALEQLSETEFLLRRGARR